MKPFSRHKLQLKTWELANLITLDRKGASFPSITWREGESGGEGRRASGEEQKKGHGQKQQRLQKVNNTGIRLAVSKLNTGGLMDTFTQTVGLNRTTLIKLCISVDEICETEMPLKESSLKAF